jgi:hypothetical protein
MPPSANPARTSLTQCARITTRVSESPLLMFGSSSGDRRAAYPRLKQAAPGFYFRGLQEGEVGPGDKIVRVGEANQRMTVAEINALLYSPDHARDRRRAFDGHVMPVRPPDGALRRSQRRRGSVRAAHASAQHRLVCYRARPRRLGRALYGRLGPPYPVDGRCGQDNQEHHQSATHLSAARGESSRYSRSRGADDTGAAGRAYKAIVTSQRLRDCANPGLPKTKASAHCSRAARQVRRASFPAANPPMAACASRRRAAQPRSLVE